MVACCSVIVPHFCSRKRFSSLSSLFLLVTCMILTAGCGEYPALRDSQQPVLASRYGRYGHAPESSQNLPFRNAAAAPGDDDFEGPELDPPVPEWIPASSLKKIRPEDISIAEKPERTENEATEPLPPPWRRRGKVAALNLVPAGLIGLYGVSQWGWGEEGFRFGSEGGFGKDTKYGGADKLGHAWMGYVLSNWYGDMYENFGYSKHEAAKYGTISSLSLLTLVEVADGFTNSHGFSWEDQLANTIGAYMGYLRQRYPRFKESVDFRMEWRPSPAFCDGDVSDPFTDYSGQKYLLAFKPGGILQSDNKFLRAVELQAGYYTRGFQEGDGKHFDRQSRHVFVGIGLNVTNLVQRMTGSRAKGVFDYVQVPFTSVHGSMELD